MATLKHSLSWLKTMALGRGDDNASYHALLSYYKRYSRSSDELGKRKKAASRYLLNVLSNHVEASDDKVEKIRQFILDCRSELNAVNRNKQKRLIGGDEALILIAETIINNLQKKTKKP